MGLCLPVFKRINYKPRQAFPNKSGYGPVRQREILFFLGMSAVPAAAALPGADAAPAALPGPDAALDTDRVARARATLAFCDARRGDIPASSRAGAAPPGFAALLQPVDPGSEGIGIVASRPLRRDQVLASLPVRWAWSARAARVDPDIGGWIRDAEARLQQRQEGQQTPPQQQTPALRDDDLIALALCYHRFGKGEASPRWAHVRGLPTAYDSVLFWTAKELAELEGTGTGRLAHQLQAQVAGDHVALVAALCGASPPPAWFSLEGYKWALGTLWSRGHDFSRGPTQSEPFRCILPGIDFLNMATLQDPCNVEVRLAGNRVDLVCVRDVPRGDELRAVYNRYLPNARLLHLHGFVTSPNPLSGVELHATLSPQAALYAEKVAVLRKYGLPAVAGDPPHLLTLAHPLPQTLLQALAVQRAASQAELDALAGGGGGGAGAGAPPAVSAAVLLELRIALTQMLVGYAGSDEEDQAVLAAQDGVDLDRLGATERRLGLAVRLRYDERRIVAAALAKVSALLRSGQEEEEDSSSSEEDQEAEDVDD